MANIFSYMKVPPWIWSVMICLAASGIYVFAEARLGDINAIAVMMAIFIAVAIMTSDAVGATMLALIFALSATYLLPRKVSGISGLNSLNLVIIIVTISLFIKFLSQVEKPVFPKFSVPLLAFSILIAIAGVRGALNASMVPDYYVELNVISGKSQMEFLQIYILKPFITFSVVWLVAFFVANSNKSSAVVCGMVGAGSIISMAVLAYAIASGSEIHNLASQESRRYLSGIGMHANELGLMLNTIFLMVLLMASSAGGILKRAIIFTIMFCLLLSIILTFSRGAYLGVLTAIGYALVIRHKALLALILGAGVVAIFLFFPSIFGRSEELGPQTSAASLSSGRMTDIWEPLMSELGDKLLVGGGASYIMRSKAAKNESILPVGHPHSAYLEALLDVGLSGALVILLFGRHVWRLFATTATITAGTSTAHVLRGGQGCLLILLVQGATDDSFFPARSQVFVWLAYGVAWGIHAKFKAGLRTSDKTYCAS